MKSEELATESTGPIEVDLKPVALILSGQLRNFEECFPSLEEHILNHNDCHIYMHTYLDTDPEELQRAIELYKPHKLLLERAEKDFEVCQTCGPEREPMHWMWRNVQAAFRLIPPNYDCIVKARYDLSYTQPIIFADYDISVINIPEGANFLGGIGDLFAFSTPANMEYYCGMIDKIEQYVEEDGIECHPETLLKHHLKDQTLLRPIFPLYLRGICMTDYLS